MKIQKTFNTTKEEIESKKFNIFIGISLGNKWFTKENLREYLNWALEHTKDKVLFWIGDKIQAINYNVRNKNHSKYNNNRALKNGLKIREMLKDLISELPREKQNKIKILRWGEYEEYDEFCKKYTSIIYNEFKKNPKFQKEILQLIKKLITDRKFSDEEYLELSKYLLEEFVGSYSGINYELNYYGMYLYPQESLLHHFIEKLQQGKIFPELNKKLPKEKVALAIVD